MILGTQLSLHGTVFELSGREVAKRRVKSFLIIDTVQKFAEAGLGLVEIAVFVAIDLLVFQRLHKRLAGRVGQVSQLQRMPTVPTVLLKSSIHIIH